MSFNHTVEIRYCGKTHCKDCFFKMEYIFRGHSISKCGIWFNGSILEKDKCRVDSDHEYPELRWPECIEAEKKDKEGSKCKAFPKGIMFGEKRDLILDDEGYPLGGFWRLPECIEKEKKIINYRQHLFANWAVAFKGLLLSFFHFVHGLVPSKYTSHEYWNIKF